MPLYSGMVSSVADSSRRSSTVRAIGERQSHSNKENIENIAVGIGEWGPMSPSIHGIGGLGTAVCEHQTCADLPAATLPLRRGIKALALVQSTAHVARPLTPRINNSQLAEGSDRRRDSPGLADATTRSQKQATGTDCELFRLEAANLCEWLANVVFACIGHRNEQPAPPYSEYAVEALARRIHAFFRHGYPAKEDNAFLAIMYITFLIPHGMLDNCDIYSSGGIVMASRLFILCYVLAAKWQDDDSYGFANRVSLYANDFTQKTANILEASALEALDFNLSVSTVEWVQHLKHLKQWTLDMRSGTHRYGAHLTICCRINELLFLPNLKRRMRNVRPRVIHPSAVRKLYTALATNLQISTKSSTLSKLYSAESASWNSAADPVVKEYGRCVPF